MKIALNLFKPQETTLVLKDVHESVCRKILNSRNSMPDAFKNRKYPSMSFTTHHSQSGKPDSILANYGAYTRTMALDAEEEEISATMCKLLNGEPMFNRIG